MSVVGLDYNAVFAVANVYDIKITKELFKKLQILEFDFLSQTNEEVKHGN